MKFKLILVSVKDQIGSASQKWLIDCPFYIPSTNWLQK